MKHSLLSALLFFAVTGCGLCPSLGEEVRVKVPATANPWLAGEPEGTTCSGDQTASSPKPDSVPGQAPVSVEGLELEKGGSLFFDATGGAHIGPAPESLFSGPDGRLLEGGKLEFGKRPPLLGKTGVTAPMVSLLGF